LRPEVVDMRLRKPCSRNRWRFFGWCVRFMVRSRQYGLGVRLRRADRLTKRAAWPGPRGGRIQEGKYRRRGRWVSIQAWATARWPLSPFPASPFPAPVPLGCIWPCPCFPGGASGGYKK
jgi:hypothetical protein